jgi:hypothetical protein
LRAIILGVLLAASTGAFAKPPAGQGKACDAKSRCDGELL